MNYFSGYLRRSHRAEWLSLPRQQGGVSIFDYRFSGWIREKPWNLSKKIKNSGDASNTGFAYRTGGADPGRNDVGRCGGRAQRQRIQWIPCSARQGQHDPGWIRFQVSISRNVFPKYVDLSGEICNWPSIQPERPSRTSWRPLRSTSPISQLSTNNRLPLPRCPALPVQAPLLHSDSRKFLTWYFFNL